MKVIVNDNQAPKERPFPKLMINPSSKTIILATQKQPSGRFIGTIIKSNNHPVCTASDWSNEFVDFEGSVTLSND